MMLAFRRMSLLRVIASRRTVRFKKTQLVRGGAAIAPGTRDRFFSRSDRHAARGRGR
jgi:hypothetical protein